VRALREIRTVVGLAILAFGSVFGLYYALGGWTWYVFAPLWLAGLIVYALWTRRPFWPAAILLSVPVVAFVVFPFLSRPYRDIGLGVGIAWCFGYVYFYNQVVIPRRAAKQAPSN
jgi:hypothetical protein